MLEFGLDTFGDVTAFGETAELLPHAQVIRNVIDEAVQAEAVGVDFFGVGEHHRSDFAVSAPEVVLSAIAARTSRIHIGTAVTVLSSDDPVRLFQRFATLDAISNGRAEVILGRGSFTESFPLFGFELSQYEELFEDKLDLFAALVRQDVVSWQGSTRPPLVEQQVFPPVEHGRLKTWIGVGGSPESVVRAAKYDMPLMLAIIGGNPRGRCRGGGWRRAGTRPRGRWRIICGKRRRWGCRRRCRNGRRCGFWCRRPGRQCR